MKKGAAPLDEREHDERKWGRLEMRKDEMDEMCRDISLGFWIGLAVEGGLIPIVAAILSTLL